MNNINKWVEWQKKWSKYKEENKIKKEYQNHFHYKIKTINKLIVKIKMNLVNNKLMHLIKYSIL
jgi:hypothetical protein